MPLPTHDFVVAAAQTDAFERQEGRLAQARASNPKVRDFGAMMVKDHTQTTAALKAALAKAHLDAPPPGLSADQQQDIDKLTGLQGPAFDKEYLRQQIDAHTKALAVMQGYAANGERDILRQAAADTVPIVERHLSMAKAIDAGE